MADNSQLKTRIQLLKEIEDRNRRIDATSKNAAVNEDLKNRYLEKQQKLQNKLGNQLKDINKARLDGLSSAESSLSSLGSMYDNISKLERQRITDTTLNGDLTKEQIVAFNEMADINQKISQLGRDDIAQRAKLTDEYQEQLENVGGLNAEGQRHLNNLTQQNTLAQQHSSLTENQKKLLQNQLDVYDGIKDTIGGILDTAELLTSNLSSGVGLALVGAGAAGKKLLDTSYQLGGSLMDSSNIATTLFGTVFEDAVGTTKSLSQEFGGLSDVSLTTQFRTNVIAKNLGIGASEAASLTGQFSRLNDGSAETAQNLIQSTKNLAEQNGLVPSDVMADLAGSTEQFALFGKDGGKNIAEAAVAAGKLGVSMSQISGIADNLLDFESSINAELELGAMLGKNINLDKARALAMEGDLGGMVRETLSSLGGIEQFNKMDYFSKKKTAELLGVSVAEFEKMATNADKLGKDGKIIPTQYEAALNNMKAFGSQILSGVQGLGGMAVAAGQMGFNLKDGLSSIKGMASKLPIIGKLFGGAADASGPLTKAGKPDMRFKANKGGGISNALKGKSNPAGKGGMMDSMSKINMNAVLKGAAAMVIVAGAVFVFGKAVQEFMKVSWEAVGMAVVSMLALVGAVSLLGAIMMSGVGAVAILAGAAAMLVIASSVLVLGLALQEIGTGFEMLSSGIGTLMPQLLSISTVVGGLVLLIPAIGLLSLSLMGLSASLVALGVAGILASPGLLALSVVGSVTSGLNSIMGGGDDKGSNDENPKWVEELKTAFRETKDVYMDGAKVTALVGSRVNKMGSNTYPIT